MGCQPPDLFVFSKLQLFQSVILIQDLAEESEDFPILTTTQIYLSSQSGN